MVGKEEWWGTKAYGDVDAGGGELGDGRVDVVEDAAEADGHGDDGGDEVGLGGAVGVGLEDPVEAGEELCSGFNQIVLMKDVGKCWGHTPDDEPRPSSAMVLTSMRFAFVATPTVSPAAVPAQWLPSDEISQALKLRRSRDNLPWPNTSPGLSE